MAYAFLRSVRSRLLMAFLLTAVIPLLLLSILFYAGFKEEMQAIQTDTRRQVWDSLTERAHESVGSAQRLAQTKLLYWRERLEAIASLASNIYLHPENYKRGPLLWSPLGFFFSSMEGKANVGLIYSPSSKNILSLSHFSRFSYVAPLLASVYEGGDIQNVWIVLKNRAYIIYPGVNHERLAKEGKLDLKTIMAPEPSGAITDFSEGQSARLDPVYLDLYGGGYLSCFRVPIRSANETLGAVAIDIMPEKLLEAFDVDMLIDPNGHIIAKGRPVRGGVDPSLRRKAGTPLTLKDSGLKLVDGVKYQQGRFVALKPLEGLGAGWWISKVEDPKALSKGLFYPTFLKRSGERFLGYIRNVFILALFLSFVLTFTISGRILNMFEQIRRNLLLISERKFERVPRSQQTGRKDGDELSKLLAITSECASLISKQIQDIEAFSSLDPLTRLFNRRPIYAIMASKPRKGALVMLDIDHFKRVNDTYGHVLGDAVIEHIGQVLQANTRDGDMAVRWGGEEFLVYLPRTTEEDAALIAERIRRKVALDPVEGIFVTISLGVADGTLDRQLIKQADEALYKAKQAGRNLVMVYEDGNLLEVSKALHNILVSSAYLPKRMGDEQSNPRPSLWLRIPVVFQLGQALSVLKKLGYRLSVINGVFPNIPLEQLKQSPFFCARCNQEGLGVGVLLVDKAGVVSMPKGFSIQSYEPPSQGESMNILKDILEAHGFIMPNPNQAWHFELPNMDQL